MSATARSQPSTIKPGAGPELPVYRLDAAKGPAVLAETEWLLTDGRGGFAMGTACGTPTRRYHGLLVASMAPPVQREVMLHSMVERLTIDPGGADRGVDLACFRFRDGVRHPRGDELVKSFEKGVGVRWEYRVGEIEVEKTLHLGRGDGEAGQHGGAVLRYRVSSPKHAVRLDLRPLVAMRDAHSLLHKGSAGEFAGERVGDAGVRVTRRGVDRERVLSMEAAGAGFRLEPQWWYGFEYEHERDRGYDCHEDLYSPGRFTLEVSAGGRAEVELLAWLGVGRSAGPEGVERGLKERAAGLVARVVGGVQASEADRAVMAGLALAADDFVVRRGAGGVSIIAGYPWFADWGRDSMIGVPGLLLATGRYEEARRVLATFAAHTRRGLVPNLFNDRTGEAEYNTVDASLWFVRAACEYLAATRDRAGFEGELLTACIQIVEAYREGTDFGIRMDPADGLIAAGDETTQLTWMDAKRDGTVFTPRHGKPVEVNALWHHGLIALAAAMGERDPRAAAYRSLAARSATSFRAMFWNEVQGCCYDVLTPAAGGAWRPDARVRPNQVFAASLEHSPLTITQRRALLRRVKKTLLTPEGLRTLDPADPGYQGRYGGMMRERDAAYHNGTVWPWLLGAYAEAVLRCDGFSAAARAEALAVLRPLAARLRVDCLGQLPEVYDGDDEPGRPRRAGGCPAQAWSVGEVLRGMTLALAT